MIEFHHNHSITLPRGWKFSPASSMRDDDRINNTMEQAGVGYDTVLRQELKKLAKEIRADENAECERIATQNESKKTVDGIRERMAQEH